MRRQLLPALRVLVVLTVLTGLAYPLLVTGVAQAAFASKADGSVVTGPKGNEVGSSLIGQTFEGDQWFHGRPSAAGDGYDPTSSSSSNLGPTNPDLLKAVAERVDQYRKVNGLSATATVPVDAVTASGSGLDPTSWWPTPGCRRPALAAARGLAPGGSGADRRAHHRSLARVPGGAGGQAASSP